MNLAPASFDCDKKMYSDNIVMSGRLSSHAADNRPFDFMQTRLLMKVFKAGSIDVINESWVMLNIRSASSPILNRKQNYLTHFIVISSD